MKQPTKQELRDALNFAQKQLQTASETITYYSNELETLLQMNQTQFLTWKIKVKKNRREGK